MDHELFNKTDKQLLKVSKLELVGYIRTLEGTVKELEGNIKEVEGVVKELEGTVKQTLVTNRAQAFNSETHRIKPKTSYKFFNPVDNSTQYKL